METTPTTSTHPMKPPRSSQKKQNSNTPTKTNDSTSPPPKPKQTKSRNGCVTCKTKRLKCDETKPACQQCQKRSVLCGGYKKDFKWKPFEETAVAHKTKAANGWNTFNTTQFETPLPSPSIERTSYTASRPPQSIGIPYYHENTIQQLQTPPFTNYAPPYPTHNESTSFRETGATSKVVSQMTPKDYKSRESPSFSGDASQGSLSPRPSCSGQTPRLIDLLLPGSVLNAAPGSVQIQPVALLTPPSSLPSDSPFNLEFDCDDIEEIVREPMVVNSWTTHKKILPQYNLFKQPELAPGSPEMLMMRFDKQTCGILSVKDGPTENPWRTLVWPLARDSPALYHAIASMTAFHGTKAEPCLRMQGMEHMRNSIRSLAAGIGEMRTDTALATTLALAFSESWDQHISTGIEHLRGAKVLVRQAVIAHKRRPLRGDDLLRLRFLCSTFVYMTVIARLTSIEDEVDDDVLDSLQATFLMNTNTEIDPLMGCASTLFPLIGKAANLCRNVRGLAQSSDEDDTQAQAVKEDIEHWLPPPEAAFECAEDPTSEVRHALQTAESYRFATLLYLHQAFPQLESLGSAELARKVFDCLAAVPLSSRLVIIQIFPLLAAGCEAQPGEERLWVEQRWSSMASRMWIGNVDRCWEVMQEVWSRRDERLHQVKHGPSTGLKRKIDEYNEDFDVDATWNNSGKRQKYISGSGLVTQPSLEADLTVRGRLHWVGVMKDWDWEILLG